MFGYTDRDLTGKIEMQGDGRITAINLNKCYLCGHEGTDVAPGMYFHFGGEGEVMMPVCADEQACFARMDAANAEWQQAMGLKKES